MTTLTKTNTLKELSNYYANQGLLNNFIATLIEIEEELLELGVELNSKGSYDIELDQYITDLIDDTIYS